ncbi:MAG: glycosyltransferase [Thermoanaerobaculia bacterium]
MRIAVVGPVYPYRAGIAYCTTALAEELAREHEIGVFSFRRQFPRRFYPGGDDRDETLAAKTPAGAHFRLDILSPFTWIREGLAIRRWRPDTLILVWWIWVWAIPYLVIRALAGRNVRVVLQCHNVSDKEPAWWKTMLSNAVLRRADALVVHARSEEEELVRRIGHPERVVRTFLPVHALGGAAPSRGDARKRLGILEQTPVPIEKRDRVPIEERSVWADRPGRHEARSAETTDSRSQPADRDARVPRVALFFGHVRPFKGLDIALRAWAKLRTDVLLLVAGEVWWNDESRYRDLVRELGIEDHVRLEFRFIPDAEIATYFAACDVVVAPYRAEAQSGVAMTAFHFGRPIIATRVGGIPEVVEAGVNGMLIPPEEPEALAMALDRFFTSEDRAAMEDGARTSAARYSWTEYAGVFLGGARHQQSG